MNGGPALVAVDEAHADPARLERMLEELASITASPGEPGVTRLAYTAEERRAHALVGRWLGDLGLRVWTDAAGNTLAELGGGPGLSVIGTGSHLDSVERAGRFDGIAGVVAAVEAARLISVRPGGLRHGLRVVLFAGEEGARFGHPCLGSSAVAGQLTDQGLALTDREGVALGEAMRSVGLDPGRVGAARWNPSEWAGFLELHVEQGNVLENTGNAVGVVDDVSGSSRFELTVRGRAGHSGGTPMDLRADALTTAAEIVLAVEAAAGTLGTRCTVGRLTVAPGGITTVPGVVRFTVDVRDVDPARLREVSERIRARAAEVCEARGTALGVVPLAETAPVHLPPGPRETLLRACRAAGVRHRVMPSGASHDAQVISTVAPAGILFVPSRDGISHAPEEWTSVEDLAVGTDVLVQALLELDAGGVEGSP